MNWRNFLSLSALILSVVNAFFLLKNHLRDRPILKVSAVHPEVYQWWFDLPEGEFEGKKTRKYGFLSYIKITNRGLRKVSLSSWRLYIKNRKLIGKKVELKPMSIPEPIAKLGNSENIKVFSVLGQGGPFHSGDTIIEPGTSISGIIYYVAEFYGDEVWNPKINGDKIKGNIVVKDAFGKKKSTKITFSKKSLDFINEIVEDIEKIR